LNWEDSIQDYKMYLKIEKGKSDNTVESYLRDIIKLQVFCEENNEKNPIKIDANLIQQFVYEIAKTDYKTRSQARLISAIKSFFKFLLLDERREDNPAELIELPKIGLYLPDTLSEDEIGKLISSIDLSSPQGERNRAILETLYGCGLRVSELINLKISDLFFEDNFLKVTGKGNKQRLVPISDYAITFINIYKNEVRNHLKIEEKYKDFLFLNRNGRKLSRVMIFIFIKELAKTAGITQNISPHTFRHSFASHLLHNGADLRSIQMMLGHESIITTEIYTHINQKHLQTTILDFHPRNRKK